MPRPTNSSSSRKKNSRPAAGFRRIAGKVLQRLGEKLVGADDTQKKQVKSKNISATHNMQKVENTNRKGAATKRVHNDARYSQNNARWEMRPSDKERISRGQALPLRRKEAIGNLRAHAAADRYTKESPHRIVPIDRSLSANHAFRVQAPTPHPPASVTAAEHKQNRAGDFLTSQEYPENLTHGASSSSHQYQISREARTAALPSRERQSSSSVLQAQPDRSVGNQDGELYQARHGDDEDNEGFDQDRFTRTLLTSNAMRSGHLGMSLSAGYVSQDRRGRGRERSGSVINFQSYHSIEEEVQFPVVADTLHSSSQVGRGGCASSGVQSAESIATADLGSVQGATGFLGSGRARVGICRMSSSCWREYPASAHNKEAIFWTRMEGVIDVIRSN